MEAGNITRLTSRLIWVKFALQSTDRVADS